MRLLSRLFCFALWWSIAAPAIARESVDHLAQHWITTNHIPGMSIAVLRHGKFLLSKGYGAANLEWSTAATPTTVYQLGSVTKQFTAAAILRLVENKAIALDDEVMGILPSLPATWNGITVRHLMNHTSGVKNYSKSEIASNSRKDYSKEEILAFITSPPLEFKPGDRWNYSNSNYFILGLIIEKVSGREYGTYLEEQIFKPLGMRASRLNVVRDVIPERAAGYTWLANRVVHAEYVSPTQPFSAGALLSSVADLIKWDAALYTDKLLPKSARELMWTSARLNDGSTANYGFGWNTGIYRKRKRMAHDGVIDGFSSYIARFPDDELTVIVLMNKDGGQAEQLANAIAELYLPALKANAPRPIEDSKPALSVSLREILRVIATGTAEPQWFTADGQNFFFPDRIKDGKKILGAHGELQSFELMEETIDNGKTVRGYRAEFGTMPLRVKLTLDAAGKIDAIRVEPEQ